MLPVTRLAAAGAAPPGSSASSIMSQLLVAGRQAHTQAMFGGSRASRWGWATRAGAGTGAGTGAGVRMQHIGRAGAGRMLAGCWAARHSQHQVVGGAATPATWGCRACSTDSKRAATGAPDAGGKRAVAIGEEVPEVAQGQQQPQGEGSQPDPTEEAAADADADAEADAAREAKAAAEREAEAKADKQLSAVDRFMKRILHPKLFSIMQASQKAAKEAWIGLKLIGSDVKLAVVLMYRSWNRADKMTRRERRHIARTTIDLLKLVPFLGVMALPGGSVAIPICMRFAPGLLPSTFKQGEPLDLPQVVQVKRHISQVVKDRVHKLVDDLNVRQDREQDLSRLFRHIMYSVDAGDAASIPWDVVGERFNDRQVLDLLETDDIAKLSTMLGKAPTRPRTFMSYRLMQAINVIYSDDEVVAREGVAGLSDEDVHNACSLRHIGLAPDGEVAPDGTSAVDHTTELLRAELRMWLELAHTHKVPATLLLHVGVFRAVSPTLVMPLLLQSEEEAAAGAGADADAAADAGSDAGHEAKERASSKSE